ncbi:hypothetical protein N7453_000154 [Penicillium expansum]|nr:hypothetical protein N7453_000154 [Penicillium expansum]
MERFLRSWRQDALNRGQHDSAIYIGDKVLALTNSDSDAFWLAQVHFSNNNFTRALALLSRKDLVSRSTACRYLAAHCYIKQNQFEQALSILGEHNPTDLIRNNHTRRKIQHQSHVTLRNGKSATPRSDRAEEREREDANNIRFEAAMCYLRGLCFAKQNAFDRARDCYKDAVRIDVQCFEAFDQLMKNSLMSPTEELEFLESLDFDSVSSPDPMMAQEAAHFTKMLYTTRLSKYSSPTILSDATETLSTHYNLADNPDILLSRAEALYTQCRFAEALELTSSILLHISINRPNNLGHAPAIYPLHLACLYETGATNALFLLSHMLADHSPEEPYTYLAIGVYYLSVSKVAEARRFFSKASLLDPHSAPAWIGFAHTFAAEGEHDQAIAAYSTAARLFQGSHLPQLFLGMQHLALNNMSLAHEYLCAAHAMSTGAAPGSVPSIASNPSGIVSAVGGDPLVLNELGVVFYHQNHLSGAIELFGQALALATSLHCEPSAWVATRANLGHAFRRMGRLSESLREFDECLRVGAGGSSMGYSPFLGGGTGGSGAIATASGVGGYEDRGLTGSLHTSRGLVLLELGRTTDAVTALHEAVRVLGASGGGDAAGGAGVAALGLGGAIKRTAQLSKRVCGKPVQPPPNVGDLLGLVNIRVKSELPRKRCLDDVDVRSPLWKGGRRRQPMSPRPAEDEQVEMDLDNEADGLLRRALGRVRHSRQRRPAVPATPDMDANETPAPSNRSRGIRHGRSHSGQ